jgi:hypothetical protein
MSQRITLSLKQANIKFAKKQADRSNTSVSKMVDDYFDLLQRIEMTYRKEKPASFIKGFAGIVNTGKNEDTKSIF